MSQPIDTAYVEVRADVDKLGDDINRQITAALNKTQAEVDRSTKKVTASFRRGADQIGQQGARAGKQFSAGVTAGVAATNAGLRKLDEQIEASARTITDLRNRISESGDLGLIKDLEEADRELNKLTKRRKLLIPIGVDPTSAPEAAGGWATAFVGRLGPLLISKSPAVVNPAVAAIGGGVAVGVAATVGATLAGAIIGAAGAGGVIGGLAIAARHSAVKAEATVLGTEVSGVLQRSAVAFVPAAIDGIGIIRAEFRKSEGDLSRLFGATAQFVRPLAQGVGSAFRDILAGVTTLAQRAGPVIDAIAHGVARLGSAFRAGLEGLSDNSESAAHALGVMFLVVEAGVRAVFAAVNALTELYSVMRLIGAARNGDVAAVGAWVATQDKGTESTSNFSGELQTLLAGFKETTAATADATAATRAYTEANARLTEQNLSAAEAQIRYRQAVDEAKDAVDRKRAVSQAEDLALISLARSSNTLITSLDRQGASAAVLGQKHQAARTALINTAVAAGYTRERAEQLADEYLQLPRSINTNITADTDQAARNLRAVRDLAASIRSKKVVITVDVRGRQTVRVGGRNVPIGSLGGVQEGGLIEGPGRKGVDSVPKLLAPGEYVVNAQAVDRVGVGTLEAINSGRGLSGAQSVMRLRELTDQPTGAAPVGSAVTGLGAANVGDKLNAITALLTQIAEQEPSFDVRTYLGTREIRDIVGTEITRHDKASARRLAATPRTP